MTRRRSVLVLGLGGLMLSAISRVAVAGPTHVEAEGYAGSSVGQWTCGPTARANYGGVGGNVRFYTDDRAPKRPEEEPQGGALKPDPTEQTPEPAAEQTETEDSLDLEPHGFSLGAGGGAEYRAYTRIACNDTPCSAQTDAIPPTRMLGAGRAGFGYDWDYFGLRVGALVFQRWADNDDKSLSATVLPDIDLRFGRRAGFHGALGFGAYNLSTISRPGAYLGMGYGSGPWAFDLRGGAHLTFDDQVGIRGDVSMRYAVSRVVAPGLGLAVSSAEQLSPEGRLFVVFTP
ncbi:MAG: hypothetical protein JWP87_6467 [Labilithrix sp.]|nr:hypothetical protein [Labilithrix sp.]